MFVYGMNCLLLDLSIQSQSEKIQAKEGVELCQK